MSAGLSAPTWRQLRVALREMGALPVRVRGSHETWRFSDGESFMVVVNHLADDVPTGIAGKFRRLRQRRSARAREEPLLLGRGGVVVIPSSPEIRKGARYEQVFRWWRQGRQRQGLRRWQRQQLRRWQGQRFRLVGRKSRWSRRQLAEHESGAAVG